MTAAFWLSTGRKIATVLISTVLGAGALYALYHLARFLLAATAEERAWTGITVAFIAAVGFGYWISCRLVDFVHAARELLPHMEAGAQFANRAALDAQSMRVAIGEWLDDVRDWMENWEADPETQPHPIVGPDTVPEAQAIRLIADVELAWEVARLEQIMRGDRPSPKRRSKV